MEQTALNKFTDLVKHQLENEALVLPTLPDIALEIRQRINSSPNLSSQEISELIGRDPALAARLIQISNSALYGRGENLSHSINEAIINLGVTNAGRLITSIAIKETFKPASAKVKQLMNQTLQQTLTVAAICRGMAMFAGHLNPDEAMLAGLVHQIGMLPVLWLYEDSHMQLSDKELARVLDSAHGEIGQLILESWNFPDELVEVPANYQDFQRNKHESPDYTDIVTVSYLQACAGTFHAHSNIDWDTVPAFAKLGLSSDLDELSNETVQTHISAAQTIL